MKIFLSWSGKRSRETAEILKDWIPQVIQAVEPWLSPDIEKGKRWSKEVSDNLEKSSIGIICLNRDNLHEDWIHFEAGALSKTKEAYVCTFLVGLNPTDVEGPLAQFQHTLYDKNDILKLLKTINSTLALCGEKQLNEKILENIFNTFWPEFEKKMKDLISKNFVTTEPVRELRDIVEEILEIVRKKDRVDEKTIYSTSFNLDDLYKFPHEMLSEREYEVFIKLVKGEKVTEIAEQLSISTHTVNTYRARILEKLSMTTNAELTQYAMRNNLID